MIEDKATLLVRFNNEGAEAVTLQVYNDNDNGWVDFRKKLIPSHKDSQATFELVGLQKEAEYRYQAVIKLVSGHLLTSNSLIVKPQKSKRIYLGFNFN